MEKRIDSPARMATPQEMQLQIEYTQKIYQMINGAETKKACVVT